MQPTRRFIEEVYLEEEPEPERGIPWRLVIVVVLATAWAALALFSGRA